MIEIDRKINNGMVQYYMKTIGVGNFNNYGGKTGYWLYYHNANKTDVIDFKCGKIYSKGKYLEGNRIGLWLFYDIDEVLIKQEYYS